MANKKGRPKYKADNAEIKKSVQERFPNIDEKEKEKSLYTFAKRLNEEFENNSINVDDFCSEHFIGKSTFSNYRNGKRIPPIDFLVVVAKELNCSTDYLLGFTDVKSLDKDYKIIHETTGLSDDSIDFLKRYKDREYELYKDRDIVYKYKHIETLNYLLKNEKHTKFLSHLGDFLWVGRDIRESLSRYIANNGGDDIIKPKLVEHWENYKWQLDRDQAIAKLKIDRSLFEMDNKIKNIDLLFDDKKNIKYKDTINKLFQELK